MATSTGEFSIQLTNNFFRVISLQTYALHLKPLKDSYIVNRHCDHFNDVLFHRKFIIARTNCVWVIHNDNEIIALTKYGVVCKIWSKRKSFYDHAVPKFSQLLNEIKWFVSISTMGFKYTCKMFIKTWFCASAMNAPYVTHTNTRNEL